jgi:hypothetical protein
VDLIALSFVRDAKDIVRVHEIMDEEGQRLPVIAEAGHRLRGSLPAARRVATESMVRFHMISAPIRAGAARAVEPPGPWGGGRGRKAHGRHAACV